MSNTLEINLDAASKNPQLLTTAAIRNNLQLLLHKRCYDKHELY